MYSKRSVEDLSKDEIKKDLSRRYDINNAIINNASIETSNIKQRFGDRLLAFANIYLAASILSSFILYKQNSEIDELLCFLCVLLITESILFIYIWNIIRKYSEQFMRQKIYREINNEITIIQNNFEMFFGFYSQIIKPHISVETLNSLAYIIKQFCEARNQKCPFNNSICKSWRGVYIAFAIIIVSIVTTALLLALKLGNKL